MGALEIGIIIAAWGIVAGICVLGWREWSWSKALPSPKPLMVNVDALAKVREINCGQWSDGSYCDDRGACECRDIAALFTATPPKLVECGLCGVMRQQGVKCSWG